MATKNQVDSPLSGTTGTGNFVGSTSPTLVTPALGTPASGVLSNCTFATGSWTPAITGSSAGPNAIGYAFQQGEYTVVGNLVFYQGRVIVNSLTIGAAAGQLQITGLPFTSVSTTANTNPAAIITKFLTIDVGTLFLSGFVANNSNLINVIATVNPAGDSATYQVTNITSTTDINVSGFYFKS